MLFIPASETVEGSKGLLKGMRTERLAPTSTRKEIFPAITVVTQGSIECSGRGWMDQASPAGGGRKG